MTLNVFVSGSCSKKISRKKWKVTVNENQILCLATESSVDEAPIDPSLGSRLGPSTANANLLENMEKKMSGQKTPEKSSIEKFHQERSDQDVTGRVIKGRKIVVKAKTSPFVTVLSSGQRLVLTYNLL